MAFISSSKTELAVQIQEAFGVASFGLSVESSVEEAPVIIHFEDTLYSAPTNVKSLPVNSGVVAISLTTILQKTGVTTVAMENLIVHSPVVEISAVTAPIQFSIDSGSISLTHSHNFSLVDLQSIELETASIATEYEIKSIGGIFSTTSALGNINLILSPYIHLPPDIVISSDLNINLFRFQSEALPQLTARQMMKMDPEKIYENEKHRDIKFRSVVDRCSHSFYDKLYENDNGYFIQYRNGLKRYSYMIDFDEAIESYYRNLFHKIKEFNKTNSNEIFFGSSLYITSYYANKARLGDELADMYTEPLFLGEIPVESTYSQFKPINGCKGI